MKKNLILSAIILQTLIATAQKFEWVTPALTGASNIQNSPVAVDQAGNIYAAIYTTAFIPVIIQGDTFPTLGGFSKATCVVKFDPSGNLLWGTVFSSANSYNRDIDVDDAGSVYISVIMDGGTTFNTDTVYSNLTERQIIKLNTNGDFVKTLFFPNVPTSSPWLDCYGNEIYVASYNRMMKLDTALNTIWTKNAPPGFVNFSAYQHTSLFANNNTIIIVGYEGGDGGVVPFGSDSIHYNVAGPFNEKMLIKLDTAGNMLWEYSFSDLVNFNASGEDSQGNIYTGASGLNGLYIFGNDTLFNAIGPGIAYSAVLKWDASGTPLNAVPIYTTNNVPTIYDMEINATDEVLFTMNASLAVIENISLPWNHVLIKLDSLGNVVWYKTTPVNLSVYMDGLEVRNGNEYIIAGYFISQVSFGCIQFPAPPLNSNFVALVSEQPEPVPTAAFSVLQTGSTVLFKDTTQNATSLLWNFGDASTSNLKEPIHTYAQAGVYNVCLSATNSCGSGQHCDTITVKGIRAIVTDHGTNNGVVTAEIFGGGFTPATTVLLKKASNPDIAPVVTSFINAGKIFVRFNFTGQSIGGWDVEVTVPSDTVMTLADGFTLESPQAYSLDFVAGGPRGARTGRWTPTYYTLFNNTNTDAVGVPVMFRYNSLVTEYDAISVVNPSLVPFLNSGLVYLQSNSLNTNAMGKIFSDANTLSKIAAFIIPLVKANSSVTFSTYLISGSSIVFFNGGFALYPMLESTALVGSNVELTDFCSGQFLKNGIESALSISINSSQWNSCYPSLHDSLLNTIASGANDLNNYSLPFSYPAFVVAMLSSFATTGCVSGIPAVLTDAQIDAVINKTLGNLAFGNNIDSITPACPMINQYRLESFNESAQISTNEFCELIGLTVISPFSSLNKAAALFCKFFSGSFDPNQKSGMGDNTADIFQKPGAISSYTIAFENLSSATAPAQVVMITDTLDASRFDFSTFQFGSVMVGDSLKFMFDEPGFSQIKLSSLAPLNSDYLRTEATFDTTTGIIKWLFTTVDPVSYQPDTNVLAGFLPPNVNGNEGAGYITYTVKLKSSLVTGDSINNIAEIIFDNNAPINTNNWLNVIDIDKPQSAVNALPPNVNTASFSVTWGGSDVIAGIRSYSVYVSVNDQPYQLWLANMDSTQYTFNGINGNQYEFFSKAMDRAGNFEDAPLSPDNNPDAVTTVVVGIEEIEGVRNILLYPNPSSQSINFSYDLTEISFVAISVFDIVGSEVSMYANEKQIAGNHQKKIDLSGFSEGIYLLKINVNGNELVKKLIKM